MNAENLTATLVARGRPLKPAVDKQPAQEGLSKVKKDAGLYIGYKP